MLPERYVPRRVSNISKRDSRIAVVGRIIDVDSEKGSFVIDDDSGKIEVFFGSDFKEKISKGKTVQAFCTLVGEQLMLDVIQDLAGLDLNLLKTVDDLYSKAGV